MLAPLGDMLGIGGEGRARCRLSLLSFCSRAPC